MPAAIQLTRIFEGANSFAAALVNPISAALLDEYAASQEPPVSPQIEDILTTHPSPLFKNFGMAARVHRKAARTLTAKTRSQSSRAVS